MTIEATTTDGLWMENVTYDELAVGHSARLVRTVTLQDIQAFAAVSGDINPAHLNPEYADATMFHGVIAHGMLGAALISALFGTQFPGPGTIYLGQELKFTKPVRIGDTLDRAGHGVGEKRREKAHQDGLPGDQPKRRGGAQGRGQPDAAHAKSARAAH